MPDAAGDSDPVPYRVVVDETSFDFRGLPPRELTNSLDDFNEALNEIMKSRPVAVADLWHAQQCLDEYELAEFLCSREGLSQAISPDVKRRVLSLMDRCRTWEQGNADVPDEVTVHDRHRELAWTLGHALLRTREGTTMACLLFPTDHVPSGWQQVSCAAGNCELYFLRRSVELPAFLRGVYTREAVPEPEFLTLACDAFPRLVLSSSLSFGKFKGSYREVYDWVVRVLTVLNDHLEAAVSEHNGLHEPVRKALSPHGVDISPESPNTHVQARVMRQRHVEYEGETYVCEWHAKQHWDRNRIHFTLPEQRLGQRVLVGLFTDHLDT